MKEERRSWWFKVPLPDGALSIPLGLTTTVTGPQRAWSPMTVLGTVAWQLQCCTHFLRGVVLKSNDVRDMAAVLDAEELTELGLLQLLELGIEVAVDAPEPQRAQTNAQASSSKHLSHRMVAQVHAGVHDQRSQRPRQCNGELLHVVRRECELEGGQVRQVDGKEYHEL
jgi:hypothetical protein